MTQKIKTDQSGTKKWYLDDKLHREDGPAVEYANGNKSWYLNEKLHREDGPAVEWADGNREWYLNGEELTKEEFEEKTRVKVPYRCVCKVRVLMRDGCICGGSL